MLKKFKDRRVKRVTSVFNTPVLTDKELNTNDKLGVIGEVKDKHRKEQLGEVLSDFENTLSEEPGLNKKERFHIDTIHSLEALQNAKHYERGCRGGDCMAVKKRVHPGVHKPVGLPDSDSKKAKWKGVSVRGFQEDQCADHSPPFLHALDRGSCRGSG